MIMITRIMCFLGASKMVEFVYNNFPDVIGQMKVPNVTVKDDANVDVVDVNDDEDDAILTDYNDRSNISGLTNDVDRLLEQSSELCAEQQ